MQGREAIVEHHNPLEQFAIQRIVPLHIGGIDVSITNSTITGGITANGPAAFTMCASTVGGLVAVQNATGPVTIGDPLHACPGTSEPVR